MPKLSPSEIPKPKFQVPEDFVPSRRRSSCHLTVETLREKYPLRDRFSGQYPTYRYLRFKVSGTLVFFVSFSISLHYRSTSHDEQLVPEIIYPSFPGGVKMSCILCELWFSIVTQ